jgi:multicomponent Na+:H+ antiporter subunit B
MKIAGLLLALLTGGLLIYGEQDMPGWGDGNSPASRHVSPRYIEKALEETGAPNMVTAVLADYRSFDTLGETTVIFTAGLSCLLLLRRDSE